ncbi:hypothetical protein SAPIO_CDS3355 [Scedosporium apiospermum]|uniref:HMG box domain-containing protein n=1 Tax=Pseudallescheria apiosperma TaxID=563466 RepID=A0A084GAL0_PSEDA|nr:uncharacterized protein SAPIO_CDS3355 [Scedosporium apiospermum]KEZ44372.1 hypothetical protein SAPIO_CDS3355 [Scedosporium apiospermum]
MQELAEILSGLGMSQYLGSFMEEGFDSWDTILDITESDLDALGVKLGHRRPDRNAPEKPPSAYVVFSNIIREGLKGQNLSFTEIAKLVGESWKSLPHEEKETLETQAQRAKEKYSYELAKYKKTPEYQKYSRYLQEFKKKHQKSGKGQGEDTRRKVEANSPLEQRRQRLHDAGHVSKQLKAMPKRIFRYLSGMFEFYRKLGHYPG